MEKNILFQGERVGGTEIAILRVRSIPLGVHCCQILALDNKDVELPQLVHIV